MRYLEYPGAPLTYTQCLDHGIQLLVLAGAIGAGELADSAYIDPERLTIDEEEAISAPDFERPAERWCPPLSENGEEQSVGCALYTIGLLLHRMLSGTDILADRGWDADTVWQISRDEAALLSAEEFENIVPAGATAEEREKLIESICGLTSFSPEGRQRACRDFVELVFAVPCSLSIEYRTADGTLAAAEQHTPTNREAAWELSAGVLLPSGFRVPERKLIYRPGTHTVTVPLERAQDNTHAQPRAAQYSTAERDRVQTTGMREIIAGIDLGTETALIATPDGGSAKLLRFDGDAQYLPSVLMFKSKDECIVGDVARNKGKLHPRACVSRFKRCIGDTAPVTGDITALDGSRFRCTGQEAAGRFLSALRGEIAEQNIHLSKVVLTVPADFSSVQRRQSRQAVLQAGFLADELRLIEEPTAAAIYYGCNKRDGLTAVADLGGGTFDCCVMECRNGRTTVQTKGSDMNLGGCDFTDRLAELIKSRAQQAGVQLFGDGSDAALTAQMEYQINTFAERIKIDLSTESTASARIPYRAGGEMRTFELTVRREEFEELLAPFVNRVTSVISDVLSAGGYTASDMDSVVIMGGSTYIPVIEKSIRAVFDGCPTFYDSERTAAVALGAAMYAQELWGGTAEDRRTDSESSPIISSTQDDLGVVNSKREFCCIIPSGTIYSANGCSGEHSFNFSDDNIKTLDIFLYRRRRGCALDRMPLFASDAKLASIGRLHFGELPGQGMRSCTLLVRFSLDTDGTISAVGEVHDRNGRVIHRESAEISG